jgi:hypothetical protein
LERKEEKGRRINIEKTNYNKYDKDVLSMAQMSWSRSRENMIMRARRRRRKIFDVDTNQRKRLLQDIYTFYTICSFFFLLVYTKMCVYEARGTNRSY